MKNNEKGFSAVEGLLIIVIVALLGFVGWYVWHSKQNTDKIYENTTSGEKASHVDLKKFISSTESGIKSKYPNENFCPTIDLAITLPYSASGYSYKVALSSPNYYLFLCDAKSAAELVKNNLQKVGMIVVKKPPVPVKNTDGSSSTYYESKDSVCLLGENSLMPVVSIICAYKSDFSKAAAEANPFVKALVAAGISEKSIVVGYIEKHTNDSKTYNYAEIMNADSTGSYLFYQKIGESPWTYFGSSDKNVDCNNQHAKEFKKIFGNVCSE